jgi:hypothetical protein
LKVKKVYKKPLQDSPPPKNHLPKNRIETGSRLKAFLDKFTASALVARRRRERGDGGKNSLLKNVEKIWRILACSGKAKIEWQFHIAL